MNVLRRTLSFLPKQIQFRQTGINTYERAANEIFERVRKLRETADQHVPPKLFVVERIATLRDRPHWEKKICELMGLSHSRRERSCSIQKKIGTYVVMPNTPHVCKLLWRIKHLVRVKPVVFPDGLPTPEEYTGTHLDRYGVFRIDQSLQVDERRLAPAPDLERATLTGREIAKPMHLKWMNSL
ncbi:39S ribosomal protein L30, mitochondrial [Galendromus occidentalis]|uniref:39S ribosomal protein L30, mitochondrial n=1 Tax=Galendromus occidentalis TaxID=34638 RepID=A0AAJ7L520_9ACAR|nr:39S ribosomal protein L30, mitochondrial [Galendromus occidentalis]